MVVKSGVTLIGAGQDVTIIDGAAQGPPAFTAHGVIDMAPNAAVISLTVENGARRSIRSTSTPVFIADVHTLGARDAVKIDQFGGSTHAGDIVITGNHFVEGVELDSDFPGRLIFSGNTVTTESFQSEGGVSLCCAFMGGAFVVGNAITNTEDGLFFEHDGNLEEQGDPGFPFAIVSRNSILGTDDDGIDIRGQYLGGLEVSDNFIRSSDNGDFLVCCEFTGQVAVMRNVVISGSQEVEICCNGSFDVVASGNLLQRTRSFTIKAFPCCAGGGEQVNVTVSKNEVLDGGGILVEDAAGGIVLVSDNFVDAGFDVGIEMDLVENAQVSVVGNTITNMDDNGMEFDRMSGSDLVVDSNISSLNSSLGIDSFGSANSVIYSGNTLSGNGEGGLLLRDPAAVVDNNLFERNGMEPILLDSNRTPSAGYGAKFQGSDVTFTNNVVIDNGGSGVLIDGGNANLGTRNSAGQNVFQGNGSFDPTQHFNIRNDTTNLIIARGNAFDNVTAPLIDSLDILDDEEGVALGLILGPVDFNDFDIGGSNETVPDTTLVGKVVDLDGTGVASSTVTAINGSTGTTDSNGDFSISGVSTLIGDLRVSASVDIGGKPHVGISKFKSANPGGDTDVGEFTVTPQITFASPFTGNVGGSLPSGITAGDWDGGSDLDLVITVQNSDLVAVLTGGGDGSFNAKLSVVVGDLPKSVLAIDFNGDSFDDLVTFDALADQVSLLLNDTTGVFTVSEAIAVGIYPTSGAVADFNGDGFRDIAVVNSQNTGFVLDPNTRENTTPKGDITVLLGNDAGSFDAVPTTFPTDGFIPSSIVTADFDEDGELDLAVLHPHLNSEFGSNRSIAVLPGDGAGNFGAPTQTAIGTFVRPIILTADVNNSSSTDIVLSNMVLIGDGAGSFEIKPFAASTLDNTMVSEDFNGDGIVDIVTSIRGMGLLAYIGDGDGNYLETTARSAIGFDSGFAMAKGDFNNDELTDLVVVRSVNNSNRTPEYWVYLNTTGN
ncbi:MAG: right-handed parallel beta-helix repeat-containing protein [Chloroflexi bacterium]|nr:right-handed parallel beta-helix repeat-containing protein [Chloroflexota bacterium]